MRIYLSNLVSAHILGAIKVTKKFFVEKIKYLTLITGLPARHYLLAVSLSKEKKQKNNNNAHVCH